jgi:hypothetical protein
VLKIVAHSIVIGAGATAVMDLWAAFLLAMLPLIVSSVTLVAPFFVMQPAMGAGIAAS